MLSKIRDFVGFKSLKLIYYIMLIALSYALIMNLVTVAILTKIALTPHDSAGNCT